MDDPAFAIETDLQTQSILLAAANHDITALRNLLRNSSANVQDPETRFTPLHAAVAACEQDTEETAQTNGHTNGVVASEASEERTQELEKAVKTVRLLFENGAIWNDLDANGETPGCIALRLGLRELYEMFVDAGVRAELLLSRLDEYQPLDGADSDEDEEEDTEEGTAEAEVAVAEGIETGEDTTTQNPVYLSSNLTFDRNKLVDESSNGVMMQWESDIMRRTAELLLPTAGLRVLNVGHGMGIIDGFIQEKQPTAHHIIEAHPDVLARMKEHGWHEKPGVIIHEGRWQDIVPGLVEKGELFDAIYFDTFAEEYKALREFFTEHVIGMLDPAGGPGKDGGKLGFFNGMGADRQVCYDVYNKVVELDLMEAGFDVEWESISVPDLDAEGEWEGVKRKYWVLDKYRLPICSFV